MHTNLDVLRQCPLFAGMEMEAVKAVLIHQQTSPRQFERGAWILREGDPARDLGVVLQGAVQVQQEDYDGGRQILARLEPGDLFGESFACAEAPALPVSVWAAEESWVLLLDCRRTLAEDSPYHSVLTRNLMRIMADKNLAFQQKLQILSRRTTREKLLAYLQTQARRQGSRRFTIPFDRQELADYLGVDRSGLSVEISRLCREGVLQSRRREFELH